MSGFDPTPELRTERLILRPWRDRDLDPFAALNADPVVMEHFVSTLTRDESWAFIERQRESFAQRGYGLWAVEVVDGPDCIGFIGLMLQTFEAHFTPAVEVGWRLAHDAWGHGYATEGALECLRFGFDDLALDEIVSMTAHTNTRSMKVMERIGMTRDPADDFEHPNVPEGHRIRPHVLYRLQADAWRGAQVS